MKAYLLTVLVCFLVSLDGKSQDLLVTTYGDTLNCWTSDWEQDKLHFVYREGGELRQALIHRSMVTRLEKNFFSIAEVPKSRYRKPSFHAKLEVEGHLGFGHRLAKVPAFQQTELVDHLKKMKSGMEQGGSLYFQYWNKASIGIEYSNFSAQNTMPNFRELSEDGKGRLGDLTEKVVIDYFGLSHKNNSLSKNKRINGYMATSIGYSKYRSRATFFDQEYRLNGGTLAVGYTFGLEFLLAKDTYLGGAFQLITGVVQRMHYSGPDGSGMVEYGDFVGEGLIRIQGWISVRHVL